MFQLELNIMQKPEDIIHDGHTYFSSEELGQRDTGEGKLAEGFADKLLELRLAFGEPMQVNSCCRSKQYNERVGGHPRSLHVYDKNARGIDGSCAIDISTQFEVPDYRERLIMEARSRGWSIGLYTNFVHLDRRVDYTELPRVEFTGGY